MAGLRLGALILILATAVLAAPAARADEGDIAGTVARVKGAALAVQAAEARKLAEDDSILIGDILSTGAFSRLEIKMIDGGTFILGERTSFVVLDYSFSGGDDNAAVRLMSGAVRAVSGRIAKADTGKFRLETEFGTLGVRGTEFWGGIMEDGAFHVALLKGTAVVVTTRGGRVEITTPNYGTVIAGPDAAPTPPKLWPDDKLKRAAEMTGFSN